MPRRLVASLSRQAMALLAMMAFGLSFISGAHAARIFLFPVTEVPTTRGAQAIYDQRGQPLIIVDPSIFRGQPAGVRDFVLYHEMAHHVLGHVTPAALARGFYDPAFSKANEAAADEFATRALISMNRSGDLDLVAAWMKTVPGGPGYPMPQWREQQIREISQRLQLDLAEGDPAAADLLRLGDGFKVTWNSSGNPMIATYTVPYENRGHTRIDCTIILATGLVPDGTRAGDFSEWQPYETSQVKLSLKPGDRKTLTGTLRWFRPPGLTPSFRAPSYGDTGGLSCLAPGMVKVSTDVLAGIALEDSDASAYEVMKMRAGLRRIILSAASNFEDVRGEKLDETYSRGTVAIAGAKRCIIFQGEYRCSFAIKAGDAERFIAAVKKVTDDLIPGWSNGPPPATNRRVFLYESTKCGPRLTIDTGNKTGPDPIDAYIRISRLERARPGCGG